MYIGDGDYRDEDTPFYADGDGRFSIGESLYYTGTTLSVDRISATDGTIGTFIIDTENIYGEYAEVTGSNIQIHTNKAGPYIALRSVAGGGAGGRIVAGTNFQTTASTQPHTFTGERIELDADTTSLIYYTGSLLDVPTIRVGPNIEESWDGVQYAGMRVETGSVQLTGAVSPNQAMSSDDKAITALYPGSARFQNYSAADTAPAAQFVISGYTNNVAAKTSLMVNLMNFHGSPLGSIQTAIAGSSIVASGFVAIGVKGDAWGGTTNWAGYFARGNVKVENDLIVDGEIEGARAIFNFGTTVASGVAYYMKTTNGVQMSPNLGYVMHRPGSIVGAGARFQRSTGALTVLWYCDILINNSLEYSTPGVNVNANTYFSTYGTQSRGLDTFAAGDVIQVKMRPMISNWRTIDNVIGFFEVVFDT